MLTKIEMHPVLSSSRRQSVKRLGRTPFRPPGSMPEKINVKAKTPPNAHCCTSFSFRNFVVERRFLVLRNM